MCLGYCVLKSESVLYGVDLEQAQAVEERKGIGSHEMGQCHHVVVSEAVEGWGEVGVEGG